jgi:orotate phosphoribosyltransferase
MNGMAAINPKFMNDMRMSGLVRDGHFVLHSGLHSGVLLDRDHLLSDPGFASHLGYVIAKRFFSAMVQTVAAPSMWGAGLAQWVGYFLEPRARVIFAPPVGGGFDIPASLTGDILNRRVLLIDNLIFSGKTIVRFADAVQELGGQVVGAATLWSTADIEAGGKPIFGVFNGDYPVYQPAECPFCRSGVPLQLDPPVR